MNIVPLPMALSDDRAYNVHHSMKAARMKTTLYLARGEHLAQRAIPILSAARLSASLTI